MDDGYMALLVAILKNCTTERAFMFLDGKKNHRWTSEELEDIERYRLFCP